MFQLGLVWHPPKPVFQWKVEQEKIAVWTDFAALCHTAMNTVIKNKMLQMFYIIAVVK